MIEQVSLLLVALIVLGILIFVHELGHFLVAKFFRVGVVEFSIGFGPKIWKKKIAETQYALGIVPLGGYVRMIGDDPQNAPELDAQMSVEEKALVEDRSRWFIKKPLYAKSAIVLAGPAFNLIFALLVSIAAVYAFGSARPQREPIVGSVIAGYPADKAGIKPKDKVVSVQGIAIKNWGQIQDAVQDGAVNGVVIVVERKDQNGQPQTLEFTMSPQERGDDIAFIEGKEGEKKPFRVGILRDVVRTPVGFGEAVGEGILNVAGISEMTVRSLYGMIAGQISAKHIGGPLFIFGEAAESAKRGFVDLLNFMVLLSVSLAILNLLPIPILDGGHLAFFLIEALIGKPVSIKAQMIANQVGMVLLMALMIFALSNDVRRFLF